MKNVLKILPGFLLFVLFASVSVYLTSCGKDDVHKTVKVMCVSCINGGQCINGVCLCSAGYEGSDCATISRNKFLGNWEVFEKGSTSIATQYGVAIMPDTAINSVVIANFYNSFRINIKASVKGDSLIIPNQQYEGKSVVGVGIISSSTTHGQYGVLTIKYEISDTVTGAINDFGYNPVDGSNPSQWNK